MLRPSPNALPLGGGSVPLASMVPGTFGYVVRHLPNMS